MKFYKIITYPNTKIIHSGINSENGYGKFKRKNEVYNTLPLEIALKDRNEPIYNSPIYDQAKLKSIRNKFDKGSLAMVKVGKNKSSSTEFFLSLDKSPEFDGRYSNFGQIIKGIKILETLDENDFIKKIEIVN